MGEKGGVREGNRGTKGGVERGMKVEMEEGEGR